MGIIRIGTDIVLGIHVALGKVEAMGVHSQSGSILYFSFSTCLRRGWVHASRQVPMRERLNRKVVTSFPAEC